MFDIVIVEDKKITREGLVQFIDWASISARVVGAFDCGQSAIEFLSHNKVHIIITDIEMDHGNGLELAAYVHERMPQIKIIMISAFAEFSYAHQAIQYGVFSYVLKPIAEVELLEKVREATHQIMKDREVHALASLVALQELGSTLEAYLMSRAVDPFLLEHAFETLQSQLDFTRATVFVLREYGERVSMRRLKEEVASSGQKIMLLQCGTLLAGVIFDDKLIDKAYFQNFHNLLSFSAKIRIGVGFNVDTPVQLKESYESALHTYRYGFLHNLDRVTFYERIQDDLQVERDSMLYLDTSYLIKCMEAEWDVEAVVYIDKMTAKWKASNSSITHMMNQCSESISRLTSELLIDTDALAPKTVQKELELITCLAELQSFMKEKMQSIANEVKNNKSQKIRPIVKLALSYSLDHIEEVGLNLKFIASQINTSYVYLSKAFKEDYQVGYTEYMNHYRIELAKKLLSAPDAKIGDVCARIGLEQKNFYFLFKKYMGITPKEYQSKNYPDVG
jgi:two-component system response regulator YesN